MKWRFEDLVAFVHVVEAGSLTAAVEYLNLSKSAVSKRLSDLEYSLGTELFRRSRERLQLTHAGEAFYRNVTPLIRNLKSAVIETSGREGQGLTGQLRILVPVSFGTAYLRSTIATFARLHPKLKIIVEYDDRRIDPVNAGFDVGIRVGYIHDTSPNVIRIAECPRFVCCSPAYASEHGIPRALGQLIDHTGISYVHIPQHRFWEFDTSSNTECFDPDMLSSRITVNTGEAVRDMVLAGAGIAPMPIFTSAKQLREGSLIPILLDDNLPKFAFEIVHYPIFPVAARIQAFIDHMKEFFGPPYPWHADLAYLPLSEHSKFQNELLP